MTRRRLEEKSWLDRQAMKSSPSRHFLSVTVELRYDYSGDAKPGDTRVIGIPRNQCVSVV